MDYLEALSKLNKKQKKEILNEIAEKRIEKYGSAGKMANLGDRAFSILGGSGNQIKLNSTEEELFIELAQKTLNKKRNKKNKGGSMLQDDETRIGYATGEDVVDPVQETINNLMELGVDEEGINILQTAKMDSPEFRNIVNTIEREKGVEPGVLIESIASIRPKKEPRVQKAEGELVGDQYKIDANKDGEITGEDFKLLQKAEGGSIDDQMMMAMTPPMESEMESDEDMEDGYTRFIMEEALTEDEEDMLMSKLEQDEELAMLFDKVIDVAQEFAGAGPVEGPGSGVSDSIPARLSDGEFVFTAKAVEEIGADNLMAMMKDAEAKADERQPLQEGGELKEETMPMQNPMTEQVIRVEKGPMTEQTGVSGSLLDSVSEEDNPLYEEMPFKRPPVHGAGYGR